MTIEQGRDPALIAQRPLLAQPPINPQAVEWLIICLAQNKQLFDEAKELIAPHHFELQENILKLVYEAIDYSYQNYNGVTYESLVQTCEDLLEQNQSYIFSQEYLETLFRNDRHGILYTMATPSFEMDDTNKELARALLQRFARERTIIAPLRRIMNPRNEGVPSDIGSFLDVINQQEARLSNLNTLPIANITPQIGTPLQPAFQFRLTGIPFLDAKLSGQRVGDSNGILGPTGGGKTTLALHMATEAAKQCWVDAQVSGGEPDVVVFFTYEEPAAKLRPRIWSSFFSILRSRLETLTDWSALSQPGELHPYELAKQADQEYKLSEIERYQLNAPQLESCLILVDMSGSDEFPNAGNGFIPEQVSILSRLNRNIRAVFTDYAGLVCERYMQATNMDESGYRYLLKTYGDKCRKEISERFGTTIWSLHQLKGSVGTSSPFKLIHHSDASESKDFAVNMAVCMCLGTEDVSSGCRLLNISKCRYKPNEAITPTTLKIHHEFAQMVDVSEHYTYSKSERRFLTAQEMAQIQASTIAENGITAQRGPAGILSGNEMNF